MSAARPMWHEPSEQHVLGAIFFAPGAVDELGDLQSADFFAENHRRIFDAMRSLAARHSTVDVITVHAELARLGHADDVGGLEYLNALAQSVPSAANATRHAATVRDYALRRRTLEALDVAGSIVLDAEDAAEGHDRATALVAAVQRTPVHAEAISLAMSILDRCPHWTALENGTAKAGMRTHLPTFDDAVGGLVRGKVIVIGARPSVGKTSLELQILLNVARDGHQCLLFSLEMSTGDVTDRLAANLGRVNLGALTKGRFEDDDWSRVTEAAEAAASLPIHIIDAPALTLLDIRTRARRHQKRHGLDVVAIDYLQLMGAGTGRQDSRHHQIEAISRGLKQLAKELNVCVLLLSQVNRQAMQRADGEPTLADLKESGAVEEDADTVMVLHPKGDLPGGSMLIAGILLKNRQGRRGRIALAFDGATQRWVESTADVRPSGATSRKHNDE